MVLSIVVAAAGDSYYPFLYRQLFDGISGKNLPLNELLRIVWMLLVVNGVVWLAWRLATFTNNFFQPRVKSDLMNTCFAYLQNHSYGFFSNNFAGGLVRRVNRFERSFEDIMDKLYWNIGQSALKVLIVLVVLVFINRTVALAFLAWTVLYTLFSFAFARFKLKYDMRTADADSKVTARLADTITNNTNVKLFGGKTREDAAFAKLTDLLYRIRKFSWDLSSVNEAIQGALMLFLEFLVIYLAVKYWHQGRLSIGDIVLFQVYMTQIFIRVWDLGRFIQNIYERLADAEEMTQILLAPHEVGDIRQAKPLVPAGGQIQFVNVRFGYKDGNEIFRKFNLTIQPGERIALIGPSGGGKSTIVKLLLRLFDLDDGQILIDGQDIARVTQDSLRQALSMVPQDPILFHRSLYENISYSKPEASEEEVLQSARLAHAHEFISKFPNKYETLVGERGIKLSGGERQRVAIARAILKNAPILILDEATSSLDSESEYYIQDALKTLMQGKTTIVIAHRLSTIMQMDRIVVIENGKVVEEGKHEELIKVRQGVYQKLWEIQAGGFANSRNSEPQE